MSDTEEVTERLRFRLEVISASEVTRLSVCGNFQAQSWSLSTAVDLSFSEETGKQGLATLELGCLPPSPSPCPAWCQ